MIVYNTILALWVVATFGILAMVAAFWCGVMVGRREDARALGRCWVDVPNEGAAGVSVDFKQKGEEA